MADDVDESAACSMAAWLGWREPHTASTSMPREAALQDDPISQHEDCMKDQVSRRQPVEAVLLVQLAG